MTSSNKIQSHFFFTLLIGALILMFFIFKPYIGSLVLAVVFAVIFSPLHNFVSKKLSVKKDRKNLSAIVTLLIIISLVLTPLLFIAGQVSIEARNLYSSLTSESREIPIIETVNNSINTLVHKVAPASLIENGEMVVDINHYIKLGLLWSFTNIDSLFSAAAKLVFNLFIMMLALFYMLRDGAKLRKQVIYYSPLIDSDDEKIFTKLENAINSVIKGSLSVGLIQGTLTGIGFAIFGVPNPVLWGCFAVIAALIPGIGTALVIIPGVLYLLFIGSFIPMIGLIIWGALAVGMVDNFIGPSLINKGIHIHQFLILLSVLGGLSFFGPIGFILGPLILSLLFALLDIYKIAMEKLVFVARK
jgi:predicted PurR-regulated permease PerM